MSFGDSNGGGMYMPVAPAYGGGYGNGSFGMGDNGWWILVLLLALGGGWNNGFGMNGGGMFPLYQQNTNNNRISNNLNMGAWFRGFGPLFIF